jgi:hypothetical protein
LRDWDAIARDYAAGTLTIIEICTLHGVSPSALYQRINKLRWKKRQGSATKITQTASPKDASKAPKTAARGTSIRKRPTKRSKDLVRRLLIALDQKMTEFENRLAAGESLTAADSERDARTLNTLVRLFDKLKDTDRKNRDAKSACSSSAPSTNGTDLHDADRLRHDLAQRLKKLRQGLGG